MGLFSYRYTLQIKDQYILLAVTYGQKRILQFCKRGYKCKTCRNNETWVDAWCALTYRLQKITLTKFKVECNR